MGAKSAALLLFLWLPALCLSCEGEGEKPLTPWGARRCHLDGLPTGALCAEVRVPEDRSRPQSEDNHINLRIAVVPALAAEPAPSPLVILVGGPGQAATEAGVPIAVALSEVYRHRDVLLLDQRGTGSSNPLDCDLGDASLSEHYARMVGVEEARDCLERVKAKPEHYATPDAVEDLEAVRLKLGYPRLNLWGGSYGTRVALQYARRYPKRVRSMVLDGVAPTQIKLPLYAGRDASAVLERLFAACRDQPACAALLGEPALAYSTLVESLDRSPLDQPVTHPRTGEQERFHLSGEGLQSGIRGLLYQSILASQVPFALSRARAGDWGPFLAQTQLTASGMAQGLSLGMFLSVVCSEDIPQITKEELSAASATGRLGARSLVALVAACGAWPTKPLPPAYLKPVVVGMPTLLLSGSEDPITGPHWARLVAERLTHSWQVVVEGAGHGVTREGCIPNLVSDFLESADGASLDTACVRRMKRPAFFTRFAGGEP